MPAASRKSSATTMLKNGSVVRHLDSSFDTWEAIWRIRNADGTINVTWKFFPTKRQAVAYVDAQPFVRTI